jgi:ABC-2 type transport system ATP-binding protein
METAVKISGLVKDYNGLHAVDHLDLSVPKGSIYGFLGPNGAGKTTTLKMIVGMTEPTSGEIEIMGKKVTFGSSYGRDIIGYLPDVPGFYDWMTAKEFLIFSGELFRIPKKILNDRVKELLTLVDLNKHKNKKIGTYSRGMKQRLGIAQALVNNPQIVLLDEPVSALDPIGRKEVMDIIFSLAGKVTVFFSTHILSDVERICDRVVIINEGKKVLEDSMDNIRQVPDIRELEIELENENDSEYILALQKDTSIESIFVDHAKVIIKTRDLDHARNELNAVIFNSQILVKKMFVKEISLEDIFMKAVNHHA